MNTQHTPGPWTINQSNDIGARGDLLAAVRFMGGANTEGKANARLIAAAPELLEALRDLLASINIAINRSEGDTFGRHHNDAMDAIAAAGRAIAKATGA